MKKIIYLIISIFIFSSAKALEKTKEEKVAKFILENIQKDYTACYSFYKITSESFKKAKVKKLKTKLSKKSTKDYHADLLKMSTGGDTMLKGDQVKLDKNKDGKISGEDFKLMEKNTGGAIKGMGAARTSGMGLQDENLIPGKSLDYYKDIM